MKPIRNKFDHLTAVTKEMWKQLDEPFPSMQLNMTFTMDSYDNIFLLCNKTVVKSIFIKSSIIYTE